MVAGLSGGLEAVASRFCFSKTSRSTEDQAATKSSGRSFFLVYYTVSRQVDGENAERIPPSSAEHRPPLVDLRGGHAENRDSRGQIGQWDADLPPKAA